MAPYTLGLQQYVRLEYQSCWPAHTLLSQFLPRQSFMQMIFEFGIWSALLLDSCFSFTVVSKIFPRKKTRAKCQKNSSSNSIHEFHKFQIPYFLIQSPPSNNTRISNNALTTSSGTLCMWNLVNSNNTRCSRPYEKIIPAGLICGNTVI